MQVRELMFPTERYRVQVKTGNYELLECVVPLPPLAELDSLQEMWYACFHWKQTHPLKRGS